MADRRSVVITGASRGLGLASAARLYARGWHVVAAMRSPDTGLDRLRSVTGAAPGDPRLTPVTLDLSDASSIVSAAKSITEAVGAPHVVVHNAAFVAVGFVEEMPSHVVEQIISTNVVGPIRRMPAISIYSASKGAIERWAEALAHEIAPFGLGVTVLSTGTFRTDVYDENYTKHYADRQGPYAPHHAGLDRAGERVIRSAKPPERFAAALEKALEKDAPFARHAVGADARMMLVASRLLPTAAFQSAARLATGLPRPRALRPHGHAARSD